MKQPGKIILILFCIFWMDNVKVFAQDSITKVNPTIIGFRQHFGWALVHTEKLKPLKGANPWGIELDISKHFINEKSWNYCNCYPRLGFSLYYWNFNHHAMGKAYNGIFYVEPFFNYTNKLNVSMRGGFGLSYMTKPYDEISNPDNLAYSTKISFPLLLNLTLNYKVDPKWSIVFSANYQHISNGGVKQPNFGINYPTLNLGMDYTINPIEFPRRNKVKFKDIEDKINRWNISTFFAYKDVESVDTTSRPVIGIECQYSKQIANLSALTLGINLASDFGAKYVIAKSSEKYYDHNRASFFIGHEFLLGRFIFYQYMGAYIYRPYKFTDDLYQRYGISFYLTKKIHTGFSLKAHRHVAEYLDLRIGTTL